MDKMAKKERQGDKNGSKIEQLEKRVAELENDWKRALADYQNLEKRTREEKSLLTQFANMVLLESLLPVLDNFLLLEKHSEDQGVKMSVNEFKEVLRNAGLKEIDVNEGEMFDPKIMDAVDTADGEKDKVLQIIRKGYFFKEKLIRPVSVKVGHGEKTEKKKGNNNE
jgi:molecular chaperone GrpE